MTADIRAATQRMSKKRRMIGTVTQQMSLHLAECTECAWQRRAVRSINEGENN